MCTHDIQAPMLPPGGASESLDPPPCGNAEPPQQSPDTASELSVEDLAKLMVATVETTAAAKARRRRKKAKGKKAMRESEELTASELEFSSGEELPKHSTMTTKPRRRRKKAKAKKAMHESEASPQLLPSGEAFKLLAAPDLELSDGEELPQRSASTDRLELSDEALAELMVAAAAATLSQQERRKARKLKKLKKQAKSKRPVRSNCCSGSVTSAAITVHTIKQRDSDTSGKAQKEAETPRQKRRRRATSTAGALLVGFVAAGSILAMAVVSVAGVAVLVTGGGSKRTKLDGYTVASDTPSSSS